MASDMQYSVVLNTYLLETVREDAMPSLYEEKIG